MSDATSADVPGRFDVVINNQGYVFDDSIEPNVPFRTHRAIYGYSPTFIDRTNTGSAYGDNAQDFWLTAEQHNWDLGEQQRYFRAAATGGDDSRSRRYWQGDNIDVITVPGQVTTRANFPTATFGGSVYAPCGNINHQTILCVSSTNGYVLATDGTVTDRGAHGLGTAPSKWGLTTDSTNFFISSSAGGSVGVRKWVTSTFTTFSATGADSMAFLNNTLFGYNSTTGALNRYDTAGSITQIYQWKSAVGGTLPYGAKLMSLGPNLIILRQTGEQRSSEIWQYDGTNTNKKADLPESFSPQDMTITNGVVFVAGYFTIGNGKYQPAIYYYVNSSTGLLWKARVATSTLTRSPGLCPWSEGIVFTDDTSQNVMQYNMATGGVHSIASYTRSLSTPQMASTDAMFALTQTATTGYYFPGSGLASTGVVQTSLFDFDNSLPKLFRGVRLTFTVSGNSTVDIAYQLDTVDGSWTTLQTNAVSGTEYVIGQTGQAIAFQITMNTGTATTAPILKRLYVRAAPELQTFPRGEYIFDLGGSLAGGMRQLRDGSPHPKTGYEQAVDLVAAATSTTPLTVTDRLNGTFTGIIDPGKLEIYEEHPAPAGAESGIYVAKVIVRGI